MRNSDDFFNNPGNIPNYPDYYITSCGRVWSFKRNRFLKLQKKPRTGYYVVNLYNKDGMKQFQVHYLVALVYILNSENKPQINHIDGNKENNCASNLEWATSSENIKHAYDTGLRTRTHRVKKVYCPENGKIYKNCNDAARDLSISETNVWRCCNKKQSNVFGYTFRYYEEE